MKRIIFLFLILYSYSTQAQDYLKEIRILNDSLGQLKTDEAWKNKDYETFYGVPNLGVTNSCYWVKAKINASEITNTKRLLTLEYPLVDEVVFFPYAFQGNFKDSVLISENRNFGERAIKHQNLVFELPTTEEHWVFLKIKCSEQLLVPLKVEDQHKALQNANRRDFFTALYFGLMMVMLLYNLFLYAFTKDKNYLLYVFYIAAVGLTQFTLLGYTFRFMFPNLPLFGANAVFVCGAASGITSIQFFRSFLSTKTFFPRGDKLFMLINGFYGLSMIMLVLGDKNLSYKIIDASAGLGAFSILGYTIAITIKGNRQAIFFLVAWFMFLSSVIVFVLRNTGVLPFNDFTNYALLFGSAIEVVLLSIALADRINILKREKEDARNRELSALQENERILAEQNLFLEQKVQERTVELELSNEELQVTLEHLKNTQVKLVESEKMASIGVLTAGIAHEINNPINFVASNISPLKRDIDDLFEILSKYEELDSNTEELISIDKLKEELELDFIKTEVYDLLNGIQNGANRTADIVRGLRTFSRLDESDRKEVNLNDCMNSTISLIKNRVNDLGIQLYFDSKFDGTLLCFPSKLNQVFLNILTNSCDALEETSSISKEINIGIEQDKENVIISIGDNGKGMTEEEQKKVFEPFFTTKDVGKGTGLGMSIVFGIIEEHKGEIFVNSDLSSGTKILITLPLTF